MPTIPNFSVESLNIQNLESIDKQDVENHKVNYGQRLAQSMSPRYLLETHHI